MCNWTARWRCLLSRALWGSSARVAMGGGSMMFARVSWFLSLSSALAICVGGAWGIGSDSVGQAPVDPVVIVVHVATIVRSADTASAALVAASAPVTSTAFAVPVVPVAPAVPAAVLSSSAAKAIFVTVIFTVLLSLLRETRKKCKSKKKLSCKHAVGVFLVVAVGRFSDLIAENERSFSVGINSSLSFFVTYH